MFLFLIVLLAGRPAEVQNADSRAAFLQKAAVGRKIATLIQESNFKYREADEGVWVISFKGRHTDSIEVVVQADGEMVVVFSTVKRKITASSALLRQFMEANFHANYSKLAIDGDGDLLALTELTATDVNGQTLRKAVDEVATLTDTAVGLLVAEGTPIPSAAESFDSIVPGRGASITLLRGTFELSYDPKKWKVEASTEPNVTQLMHVSGDAWLKVISERLEVGSEALREVALGNARKAANDVKLESETWRSVNGLRTLVLRYAAAVQGVKVTFYNQMYSDGDGLVQLAGWTTTNLVDEHRRDFLELFAGFSKMR